MLCHYVKCHNAECHYAECRVLLIVMLNVIMLSVVMLSVVAPPNSAQSSMTLFLSFIILCRDRTFLMVIFYKTDCGCYHEEESWGQGTFTIKLFASVIVGK